MFFMTQNFLVIYFLSESLSITVTWMLIFAPMAVFFRLWGQEGRLAGVKGTATFIPFKFSNMLPSLLSLSTLIQALLCFFCLSQPRISMDYFKKLYPRFMNKYLSPFTCEISIHWPNTFETLTLLALVHPHTHSILFIVMSGVFLISQGQTSLIGLSHSLMITHDSTFSKPNLKFLQFSSNCTPCLKLNSTQKFKLYILTMPKNILVQPLTVN